MESGAGNNGMANVKDKEGGTPLHRNCQQPPPKQKCSTQNNDKQEASKPIYPEQRITTFFSLVMMGIYSKMFLILKRH